MAGAGFWDSNTLTGWDLHKELDELNQQLHFAVGRINSIFQRVSPDLVVEIGHTRDKLHRIECDVKLKVLDCRRKNADADRAQYAAKAEAAQKKGSSVVVHQQCTVIDEAELQRQHSG